MIEGIQADRGRIDVPDALRISCNVMQREAMKVCGSVGGHWTTHESLAAAPEALAIIAEQALASRRLILAEIARRAAEAAEAAACAS